MRHITVVMVMLVTLFSSLWAEGKPAYAEEMKVKTIDGKEYTFVGTKEGVQIKGLEGKVVFLEFFGHRCPPCRAMIPKLIKLQERLKGKAVVFAMEVQGFTTADLAAYAKRKQINYTLAAYKERGNSKLVNYISKRAEWSGSIPFMVVIDGKGSVQFVHTGMLMEPQLMNIYNQVVANK
jgi:thiol-disulfide isomerase/thioredoxin